MSKYIDAERLNMEWQTLKPFGVTDTMIENLKWIVDRQPTIEVSEDDLYIPLNNQTVERINRLHKDECGEYFDEEWLFNELEQISEFREVSEDCISRVETLELLNAMMAVDSINSKVYAKVFWQIKDAPSVVPTEKG